MIYYVEGYRYYDPDYELHRVSSLVPQRIPRVGEFVVFNPVEETDAVECAAKWKVVDVVWNVRKDLERGQLTEQVDTHVILARCRQA